MHFLRIDMSTKKITMQGVLETYRLLGNRGLIARPSYDEIDPQCHPLGPGNKLIIATAFTKRILEEPAAKVYTEYGTMGNVMTINALNTLPTNGFRMGTWERAEEISGEKIHDMILDRAGDGIRESQRRGRWGFGDIFRMSGNDEISEEAQSTVSGATLGGGANEIVAEPLPKVARAV